MIKLGCNMKLVFPNEKYLLSYKKGIEKDADDRPEYKWWFTKPDRIIRKAYEHRNSINLKEGYVKQSILWLIDNDEFIGEIRIRHELTETLLLHGGNIGYIVLGSKVNMGYATKMLELGLTYCKQKLDLKKVLLTCGDDNVSSIKVIEKNGGKLEDIIINIYNENKKTRRYWISL